MPTLTLKFGDRSLQECPVGTHPVTIGRLPDNMIVIDNPAVSGRHASVFREGDDYIVEDLKSTNGTFVSEKPIVRCTLRDHDVVLVGKHSLVFSLAGGEQADVAEPVPFVPDVGGTMMLDTFRSQGPARWRFDRGSWSHARVPHEAGEPLATSWRWHGRCCGR